MEKNVYRHPGAGTEEIINRNNEYFSLKLAKENHLDETFLTMDPQKGWKISYYIENVETLNSETIQNIDNLRKIADIYRIIHNTSSQYNYEFNIFREIEKYDMLIEEANAKMYEGWDSVKKDIKIIENNLNRIGIDLHPCHNDAVPENFIKTKDGIVFLIDWEYSGINDPTADIAALFLESSFSNSSQEAFLNIYYNGNVPAYTKVKIKYFQILWDFLWSQWTIIKEAKGDKFGTYGKNRFNRAIANIKNLKNN